MPHVVTIKSLPQAFDAIKEMGDQGYDWGEDYRRAGRDDAAHAAQLKAQGPEAPRRMVAVAAFCYNPEKNREAG